jgi:NAD(P)H-quinone oxidoreductase subunit 5
MVSALSLSFLAPIALLAVAAIALAKPGRRPGLLPELSEGAALAALVLTAGGLLQYILAGPSKLVLFEGPAMLALRADLVSVTMALLVGFIAWIVMRYSRSYLDGEEREGAFHGLMLATLAAVLIFVQSGSLWTLVIATVCIGFGLKRLLLFYPERPEAQRAAVKFALVWHMGDILLVVAAGLLVTGFGTADIAGLAALAAQNGLGIAGHVAIALAVAAAALKTAAFPVHGWLTEVMEAPTPVSALLHAGIINSGGVLLITLSGLVQLSPGAMAALVMLGGFTALFGAA